MKILLLSILLLSFCKLFSQNYGENFTDAENNYILVPDNSSVNVTNNFTVEFWMRPNKTLTFACILQEGRCSNATTSWDIFIQTDSTLNFGSNNSGVCTNTNIFTCNTKVLPGACTHVTLSYSSSGAKFYYNGVLQAGHYTQGSFAGTLHYSSDPLRIGHYKFVNESLGAFYDGLIDELRIWNRVLSASEIASNYQSPLNGSETGLKLYYKFDNQQNGPGMAVYNSATATGSAINGLTYSTNSSSPFIGNSCYTYASCNNSIITANGATTICQGDNITLTSNTQGYPYIFQWYYNGLPISGAINPNYTTGTSGNYSLVVDSLGCFASSNIIQITVNPIPIVSINPIPSYINYNSSPIVLTGNPFGGIFTGDGMTNNYFSPSVAGLGGHTITYDYIDQNSCGNSSSVYTIVYDTTGVVCTTYDTTFVTITDTNYISVADTLVINAVLTNVVPPNNINIIKIYPNPASTYIYIDNGNYLLMNGYTIKIDNSLSQTVFISPINQQQFYINLSTWTGFGVYFVYIIDNLGNTIETKKIVLQ